MSSLLEPYTWTPIEAWAAEHGLPVAEVMPDIATDRVIGGRIDGHWHICASRVELTHPDPQDRAVIRLRIAALRDDHVLAAGPDILTIDFRYDSRACHDAFTALDRASNPPGTELAAIRLGDETWWIHHSLQVDLAAALLCLEVEMDLGELMAQYRPDSSSLN
jgi:hypothetical protein